MIRTTRHGSYYAPLYIRRPWYKKRKSWGIIAVVSVICWSLTRQRLIVIQQKLKDDKQLTNVEKKLYTVFRLSKQVNGDGDEDDKKEEDAHHFDGRYPNSLLTLFYPYTMLRDVVLDQPVEESDIAFFWHLHNSDEKLIKGILTDCYGLKMVELNDLKAVEHAREIDLVANLDRKKHVITSPFIRETATVFSTRNFGRNLCYFRHPVDYDVHPLLPNFAPHNDNWLVRLLSDEHVNPITFKELGIAKKVIFQACVVGTIDSMKASVIRQADYFGWSKFGKGEGPRKKTAEEREMLTDEEKETLQEEEEDFIREEETCIDKHLSGDKKLPAETFVDHDSPEWKKFYKSNKYDCQLYELSRSAWRAQTQTIIPFYLQTQRNE